jgi:hypothetical protein
MKRLSKKMRKVIAIILVTCIAMISVVSSVGAAYEEDTVLEVESQEEVLTEEVKQDVQEEELVACSPVYVEQYETKPSYTRHTPVVKHLIENYELKEEKQHKEYVVVDHEDTSGFKVVVDVEDGTMTVTNPSTVERDYVVLRVKYVDRQTQRALKNEYKAYLHEGDSYEVYSPFFKDYKTERKVVSGVIEVDTTITVYYDSYESLHSTTGTVRVVYIYDHSDENLVDVLPDEETYTAEYGEKLVIELPQVEGYTSSRNNIHVNVSGDITVYVTYHVAYDGEGTAYFF